MPKALSALRRHAVASVALQNPASAITASAAGNEPVSARLTVELVRVDGS
jgi:hypothetical protein